VIIISENNEDPRVKNKGFEPEKGTYKKSAESVGQLYPVIKDEFGIVDGFHRKEDDPNWREEYTSSGTLKEHYKKMLHANFQRRIVPEEQMKEWINGIAEELEKEGTENGQYINRIFEELNGVISDETIRRYLDEKFKRAYTKPTNVGIVTQKDAEKEAEKEVGKPLETAKDYEKAAKALRKKAKDKLTLEEKEKRKAETAERKRKSREEQKKKIQAEIEKEKERIEKEAKLEAKKELKKDKSFRKEIKEEIKQEKKESKPDNEFRVTGKYVSESGVEWADYGINLYMGCRHDCTYCYGKSMFNRKILWKNQIEQWDKPKKRIIDLDTLRSELEDIKEQRLKHNQSELGKIFFCSVCDTYQNYEEDKEFIRSVLKVFLESKHMIYILTKNASIENDLDLISQYKNVQVGFTLTSLDDTNYKNYEPNASKPSERIRVLEKAHNMGITTRVSLEPWIPEFTDPFEIVNKCYKYVDNWWVGIYNYSNIKMEWYQRYIGKLQNLFMELECNYWMKCELDRVFKSRPILDREEYVKTEQQMVGTQ